MGLEHGTAVESGDLVVVEIGGDEGVGGGGVGYNFYTCCWYSVFCKPFFVLQKIVSSGGVDDGGTSQEFDAVGDISGGASELFSELIGGKAHIEHVHFFGQNVVFKFVGVHHDVIVGEGAGDDQLVAGHACRQAGSWWFVVVCWGQKAKCYMLEFRCFLIDGEGLVLIRG